MTDKLSNDKLDAIIGKIARMRTLSHLLALGETYSIYKTPNDWSEDFLKSDATIPQATDSLELENALKKDNAPIILIPENAALPLPLVKKIAERTGINKTIFMVQKSEVRNQKSEIRK